MSTSSKPKVLLLFEYASLNGGERSMLSVLEEVRQRGYQITAVALPKGPLAKALSRRKIEIEPIRFTHPEGKRFSQSELREQLQEIFTSRKPDLIHANSLSMSRLCGPVVTKIPSIGHLRDILKLSAAAIADLNCHTRLLAVSEATRQWYITAGVAEEKLHVLYNGVDLQRFCQRPPNGYLHRELNLPATTKLVGAIGQIGMRKALDVLLHAARETAAVVPEVHFLIVGTRYSQKEEAVRFESELHHIASKPPLTGRVHFLGVRDDVHLLFNELSLLVHPARQEPLGRVLLEAAASAVPVVASDVGGTSEIFPAESGAAILLNVDDVSMFAQQMTMVLRDAALQERLAASARQRAETCFDALKSASSLAKCYGELL